MPGSIRSGRSVFVEGVAVRPGGGTNGYSGSYVESPQVAQVVGQHAELQSHDRASAAGTENVVIVISPRRSALSAGPTDGPWAQREASLQRIRKVERREWQKESGYRQQARVENSFFRYKSVFGGDLKARHSKAQRREAAIGCHILNRMAELGRPSSYALGR